MSAPEERDMLLIRIGGSHRTYTRQTQAFRSAGIEIESKGCASLGSKAQHAVIPDTAQARELLKQVGGTIARRQWAHLKAGYWN